jgi:hypothetical protein
MMRQNLGVGDAIAEAIDDLTRESPTSPQCDEGRHNQCSGVYCFVSRNPTPKEIERAQKHPCRCKCDHPHLKAK